MQTLTITIHFKEKHNPGDEPHLQAIARGYLRGKGVTVTDNFEIEI